MVFLQEKQQVNIIFNTSEGEVCLPCQITNVSSDRLTLSQPENWQNYAQYLQEGEEVKTKIFTNSGVSFYQALIINSPENNDFTIEYNVNSANVIQRRNSSRIPIEAIMDCEIPSPATQINNEKMVEFSTSIKCEFEKRIVAAETIDIGSGGLKFKSEQELPTDQPLTFKINLFDDIIVAKGVLIPKTSKNGYQYGVKFTDIKEEDQDKIIKVCFKIESALKRNQD